MAANVSSTAEVKLWGRRIGAVSWDQQRQLANFEYDPGFRTSGIEVAPLTMPLSNQVYGFPNLARGSFLGLPGLLADSLPDDFGSALINAWLANQGRPANSFNPVERLCYTGNRGMGALEYSPALGPSASRSEKLNIEVLVNLVSAILSKRQNLQGSFGEYEKEQSLNDILKVGTSAGGARAKVVITWNPDTEEVRSGQVDAGSGFSHWILKFDGVTGNGDQELDDPQGFGLIEYAYYKMARQAGINMMESRLLRENQRSHFMTRRFDRTDQGMKLHMQSFGALEHFDYRLAGAYSYEQALQTIRKLNLTAIEIEEQFRRMAFNIIARNQDDHVKNISFLMNPSGTWALAPAYDVTYSYNPTGEWTGAHQMSLNGKRDHFQLDDFRTCARLCSLRRGAAEEILEQVITAVGQWPTLASATGINEAMATKISNAHRLGILR